MQCQFFLKINTDVYNVFISVCNTFVKHEEKLKTLLNLNDSFCWKTKHNTLFKCSEDSKLLQLDYRKLHRITYLFNCEITTNNKCTQISRKREPGTDYS